VQTPLLRLGFPCLGLLIAGGGKSSTAVTTVAELRLTQYLADPAVSFPIVTVAGILSSGRQASPMGVGSDPISPPASSRFPAL
jgi:hypothetical protein